MEGSDVVSILIYSVRFIIQLQIAVFVETILIRKTLSCAFIFAVIRNSSSTASTSVSSTKSVALTGSSYDIRGCSSKYFEISKTRQHFLQNKNLAHAQSSFPPAPSGRFDNATAHPFHLYCRSSNTSLR